jgi:tRNA 2-thiouridine synthesizing protein A
VQIDDLTGKALQRAQVGKALSRLQPGERIAVECTDPLAVIDIPNLIRETGDELLSQHQTDRQLIFVIAKSPS